MRQVRLLSSVLLLATALTPCFARTRRHTTSSTKVTKQVKHKPLGQRGIDDARATQIQEALVRTGYMTETTGHWDEATEAAMQKYQSDNGWQTKLMPDSRAIIKLGLGPTQTSSLAPSGLPSQTIADSGEATISQR